MVLKLLLLHQSKSHGKQFLYTGRKTWKKNKPFTFPNHSSLTTHSSRFFDCYCKNPSLPLHVFIVSSACALSALIRSLGKITKNKNKKMIWGLLYIWVCLLSQSKHVMDLVQPLLAWVGLSGLHERKLPQERHIPLFSGYGSISEKSTLISDTPLAAWHWGWGYLENLVSMVSSGNDYF